VARGTAATLAIEIERRVVDAKAALPGDRLRQWRDRRFIQVLDRPAGGADEVMVMAGSAPDVRRNMTRALEALGKSRGDQAIERAKNRRPSDVGMLAAHPVIDFLRRRLLAGLGEDGGDRQPLRSQPDAGLLQGRLRSSLNDAQMILPWRRIPGPCRKASAGL
jgi:hypothetical protein